MQPPHQHSRINLAELKAQIVKKLGPEGSKQYFYYLNRFLSIKLNKVEFNKLCLRILGHDNIPLHNELIRSILKNACTAKSPPPLRDSSLSKHGPQISGKDTSIDNYQQNGPGLSNGGDMLLPPSPKKARTGLRDRRGGDRRSALRPNGKTSVAPQTGDFNVVLENGDLSPHHHGFLHQSGNKSEILVPKPANSSVVRRCSDFSDPSCIVDLPDSVVRDGEGKDSLPKSPIRAPLGVQFCPSSAGGACRAPPSSGRYFGSVFNNGVLSDSVNLRERMEEIAWLQGLEGVSLDSANLLNHGLDSYMKRLIRSCIELVGSRQGSEITKNNNNSTHKHCGYAKLVNGVKPDYQNLVQNSGKPLEMHEQRSHCPISLQDFRVAMEMNPRKLGEDWPLLLEKICMSAFEE